MSIFDEKYEKRFVFLNCRFEDKKWFFCRYVMQYYCRSIDMMGHTSKWVKIDGKFYTEEELTMKKLVEGRIYIHKDRPE